MFGQDGVAGAHDEVEISERSFEETVECGLLQHGPDACPRGDGTLTCEPPPPYGATLLKRLASEIERRGALDVLRNGIKDSGVKFQLAYFRPGERPQRRDAAVRAKKDEDVVHAATRLADAIARRDVDAIVSLLDPAFLLRTPGGETRDADAFASQIRAIPGEILFVKLDAVNVDLSAAGALVMGIQHARVRIDG